MSNEKTLNSAALKAIIDAGVKQWKQFKDAADALEFVDAQVGYMKELNESVAAKKKQLDLVNDELYKAWDGISGAQQEAAAILKAANDQAAKIIEDAGKAATADTAKQIAAAQAELELLNKDVAILNGDRQALTLSVAELHKQRDVVLPLLENAKKALGM